MQLSSFTHQAAHRQLGKIAQLADRLKARSWCVDHSHTSKSILLPVPTILVPGFKIMLRDNFHDVNLFVESLEKPIQLPLGFIYQQHDFTWYEEEIAKKRGYCFQDWTDDEIKDPRVLRVQRKKVKGWCEVTGAEKDRWAARYTSTTWYERDWAGGKLIHEGAVPFAKDATVFYRAERAHAEGITENAEPYTGPCTKFLNCFSGWDELERVLVRVCAPEETPCPS